jgi:hypothetical protein
LAQYSSREKALSFFYSFFELLKSNRSFAVYSIKKHRSLGTPKVLEPTKDIFENFAEGIISEGMETQELSDRKFLANAIKMPFGSSLGLCLIFG